MINKSRLLKLVLLLLLLVPLGVLAASAVHHTRPSGGGHLFFSKEGKEYLACEWTNNKYTRFGTIDIESEPTSSPRASFSSKTTWLDRPISSPNPIRWSKDLLGLGIENGIGWITFRTGDTSAAIHQFDLTNNEPAQTNSIDFGESISGDSRMFLVDRKLIRGPHEQLELWDISKGRLLDSIATPVGAKSYVNGVQGTKNILVIDRGSNFAGLYGSDNESLRLIQDWKSLQTESFLRNDETFVASLLPDGATIEVRSAIDGSVVESSSVPIDSRLPLPLTSFELVESCGCFRWRSLGICTDALTRQPLPIPDMFEPLIREMEGSRLVAIRKETTSGVIVAKECVIVNETTGKQLMRFWLDLKEQISGACILKRTGHLALATYANRVHLYDLETGSVVRTIDPFKWGFPLNCATATLFGLWCIVWICLAAAVYPYGWIDSSVCTGLFIAFVSCRLYAAMSDANGFFASLGVLLGSIQLTSIWLCLGRNRLFLRSAPLILTIGLAAGLVTYWQEESNSTAAMVAGIMPVTIGTILVLAILRWSGVKFENVLSESFGSTDSVLQKESSINLRDLFLFTLLSAIVAAIVRWIPVSYWYGILFDRRLVWTFLTVVSIFAACLAAVVVVSLWTSFSRRNIVVRWTPWLVALLLFQLIPLGLFAPFFFGASATLMIGLYAYRLRGWRFHQKHFATKTTVLLK